MQKLFPDAIKKMPHPEKISTQQPQGAVRYVFHALCINQHCAA
jgi:hypothetical protein